MPRKHTVLLLPLTAVLLLALLPGCARQSNVGKTAAAQSILAGKTAPAGTQVWQTNDIRVLYSVKQHADSFSVSGLLEVKNSITASFPQAEMFLFYINYLDRDGVVVATHDISPNVGYRRDIPEQVELRDVPVAPANATDFAFSYWAIFTGVSIPDDSSGDWEIYFNPFTDNR